MTDKEQNKRINQLRRQLTTMAERVKTLELDVEPEGRISEAFTALEKHIDDNFSQVNRRLDRMEHKFNQLQSKLEVVLDFITGINDLPEDETEL